MSKIIEMLPVPPLYYHAQDTSYWRADETARWIRVNETSAKSFVVEHGYSRTAARTGMNGEVDRCLMKIQSSRNVAYIGPLAGYMAGVYGMGGRRVLVTESPRFIEASPGLWPTLQELFDGLFIDGEIDQRPYFYGWIAAAMKSFRQRRWNASQLLALAGPVGCGKSLTQFLLTRMFGGRSTQPFAYMMGRTEFNSHMFRGEHQVLEDEAESTRYDHRQHFAAKIKTMLANSEQNCHGKNKEAVTLQPIWRMSCSLNDDPERLLVLPPFDSDVQDKIIALKVRPAATALKVKLGLDDECFENLLVGELPAFLHYIEKMFVLPERLEDARYGVTAFQHPDLVERIQDTAPQMKLLEMIDVAIFSNGLRGTPFEGRASRLVNELVDRDSPVSYDARRLLSGSNAVGRYLGRLKDSQAEQAVGRITSRKVHGETIWRIEPSPFRETEPGWTPPAGDETPSLPPVPLVGQ